MSLYRLFSSSTKTAPPRFQAALRKLSEQGAKALRPVAVTVHETEQRWRAPAISRRVARVLRKQAIRDGTYGSFNGTEGWDPEWDVELAKAKPRGQGRVPQLRIPKKTSRQRTRERRARKIEEQMEGMDERMEALMEEKSKKPVETFEDVYKRLMRVKK